MSDEDQTANDRLISFSANQLVAGNLRRARASKGWTQEEAASHLAPFLGEEWSKATYSAAERSAHRFDRIRQFSADDLVAFSAAFELPVQFFFLPGLVMHRDYRVVAGDPETSYAFDLGEYLRAVYGPPGATHQLREELRDAIEQSAGQWNDADSKIIRESLTVFTQARMQATGDDVGKMRDSLQDIAFFLGDLAEAMGETLRKELAPLLDGQAPTDEAQTVAPQTGDPQDDEPR